MTGSVLLAGSLVASAILLAACDASQPLTPEPPAANGEVTGTVRFEQVEGGCWAIDLGGSQRVEPIGLPDEFKTDGLAVVVSLADMPDASSLCQIGPLKQVVAIRRR